MLAGDGRRDAAQAVGLDLHPGLEASHVDRLGHRLPSRCGVGDKGLGGCDLRLEIPDLVELFDEGRVVAENLEAFELRLDLLPERLRTVEVQACLLVAQFEVAREDGDVLGLFVVVDDQVLDAVIAQRVLLLAQFAAHTDQFLLEELDDVVGLAVAQFLVLFDELVVEEFQCVVDHAGVVVFVAHFEHVAVGDAPHFDPAQGLVAVIAVGPVEKSVDVVAVLGDLVAEQVFERLLLAVAVD